MENRNKRMIVGLFIALLAVFLAGMACEIVLKIIVANKMVPVGADSGFTLRKTMQLFGDETVPLWSLPILVLNWLRLMPTDTVVYALRWIPYLIVFLLPVLSSFIKRRWIPLLACGALALYEAVSILLTRMFSSYVYITYLHIVPFAVEAIVIALACTALGSRKKGFSITLGVVCAVLALLSPAVTVLLSGMTPQYLGREGFDIFSYGIVRLKDVYSYASSSWPIFKAFAFLMYALILFIAPTRFRKRTVSE